MEELFFCFVFRFRNRYYNQKGNIKFRHCINFARELTYSMMGQLAIFYVDPCLRRAFLEMPYSVKVYSNVIFLFSCLAFWLSPYLYSPSLAAFQHD